jgi:two-component system CheB/CheR fusion protein
VREGHGLGLNIVQKVAELLNHEMRVESEIGKGSSFSVILPPGVAPKHAQICPQSADLVSASTPRAHVLIVDDDLAVRDATRLLPKVEGYRVTIASSFDEALDRVR